MKKTNLITYSLLMCLVLSVFAIANYFIQSIYPTTQITTKHPKLSCKQKCKYVCDLASQMIERPKGPVSAEVEQKLQELKENATKCSKKCIYNEC